MKLLNRQQLTTKLLVTSLYLLSATVLILAFFIDRPVSDSLISLRVFLFIMVLPLITKLMVQLYAAIRYSLQPVNQGYSTMVPYKVSVLLPAWNEEVGIVKTIESVLQSNYHDFELIVINDGSTDKTDQLVRQFIADYEADSNPKVSIKYLSLPNGGKAHALNKGLELATGNIVITIDADCIVDRNAIYRFIQRFDDPSIGAVAGNIIVGNKRKPLEWLQQLEYVCGFFYKRADSYFNAVHIIGGAAAAYRRDVLINLKGFDEEIITEDIDLSMSILSHGYKTRYAHDAVVYTEGPTEWKGIRKQRLRWKYGRILCYLKHRELFLSSNSQHNRYLSWFILPLAVYAEIMLLNVGLFLSLFYCYVIASQDFALLASVILVSSSLVALQIKLDSKSSYHKNLLPFIPVAWLLLYVIEFIELVALTMSLQKLYNRESVKWQKWNRIGLQQQTAEQTS
ncbi:glycosyl transferase family 2 [Kangiella koreensis DSM 16069]|uniref:Glycosyl transferase family 2 n=2 Tax=Kangiella TaxID=261963 RepID=C7RAF6_KANKD|nr:glycosyl transferase family 2 [Kangiella koreensis DSM 16069]